MRREVLTGGVGDRDDESDDEDRQSNPNPIIIIIIIIVEVRVVGGYHYNRSSRCRVVVVQTQRLTSLTNLRPTLQQYSSFHVMYNSSHQICAIYCQPA